MSADPYRHVALAVVRPSLVEAAACQWCRWSDGFAPHQCSHPVVGGGREPFCDLVNGRGECRHFAPSWLTRWMRRLRLGRAPAMVDPRVWDDNHARKMLGHMGVG